MRHDPTGYSNPVSLSCGVHFNFKTTTSFNTTRWPKDLCRKGVFLRQSSISLSHHFVSFAVFPSFRPFILPSHALTFDLIYCVVVMVMYFLSLWFSSVILEIELVQQMHTSASTSHESKTDKKRGYPASRDSLSGCKKDRQNEYKWGEQSSELSENAKMSHKQPLFSGQRRYFVIALTK